MAVGSLLALLDDIATILDDVSVMTKVAAKKTAGVLGDDLALNAQQVSGVAAERELPVIWAVAKGSFINKAILVPAALLLSYFIPWIIIPLLMLGGIFLCYEGFEKVAHKWLHSKDEILQHQQELHNALIDENSDIAALEKEKIKGAIQTDFILSAEIIVITLGTVASASFSKQIIVVSSIAIIMTIGVYGLVAGIIKMDDAGLHLLKKSGTGIFAQLQRKLGQFLLLFAPKLMHVLSVLGTIAMFLVGGGIIIHGIPAFAYFLESLTHFSHQGQIGAIVAGVTPILIDGIIGFIVGAITLTCINVFQRYIKKT